VLIGWAAQKGPPDAEFGPDAGFGHEGEPVHARALFCAFSVGDVLIEEAECRLGSGLMNLV
jgi:hypothetical protein